MKKWFRRKWLEVQAKIFHTKNEIRRSRSSLEDELDDYSDKQIAMLLRVSNEYKKAKKDPDAFVEEYFSEKIRPIKPYVDSWTGKWEDTLTMSFSSNPLREEKTSSPVSQEPEEEWFDDPEEY